MEDVWGFNDAFNVHKFIKDIERNRILYDSQWPGFNDESMKEKVWNSLGRKHNLEGFQCRSLWRSLSTRYYTALIVVQQTGYIPRVMILNNYDLKFLNPHLIEYAHDPRNAELVRDITDDIRKEIEEDVDDADIPKLLQLVLRQVKLKKWCDTAVLNKLQADRVPEYKRMIDAMVEGIRLALKERPRMGRRHASRQIG